MPRIHSLLLILTFLSMSRDVSQAADADESKEPPLEFVVNVGGKAITITEGKPASLEGMFTNPKISVTPQPFRVFPYQGIAFKYPRSFTFEADLATPDYKNWTLSGNDLRIMYFVLKGEVTPDDFASNMMDELGRKNCKITNAKAKITLGKQTLSGTTFHATVASHKMAIDTYRVPSPGATTKLLVFQDGLDEQGNRSDEGKQAIKEIESSFTFE